MWLIECLSFVSFYSVSLSVTMSGQSPFELIQNGERRVTLHYLGYGRVLLCASRDFDLSRPSDGITLTPFGVMFETNLMVRLHSGYTLLVTSAAGSYIQVHTNVVVGSAVSLVLYLALNGRTAMNPRAYREQPLAVVSLLESGPRLDLPIQTVIHLDDDDDDDDAANGPSGVAAPPPSLQETPAQTPEPTTLVPETDDEDNEAVPPTPEVAAVPSSDPEEREQDDLQGAVGGTEEEGSDSSGLWTGGESEDDDDDGSEEPDSGADSEGGDDDDEVVGGDPLQGSAGNMGVRHRAGLYVFTLTPGDDEVPFPPNRGFPMRRLLREVELQLSEDARNIAWQSAVDCSCCPLDCIFFRGHWQRRDGSVVVTLAVASHMFSNIQTRNMVDLVRLVLEHRARVIFGGPIDVTGEAL